MELWNWIEYGAWALSAIFGLTIIVDWIRTDRAYSEAVLTSSQEGELEALSEKHEL